MNTHDDDSSSETLSRRMRTLSLHLNPIQQQPHMIKMLTCASKAKLEVDPSVLSQFVRGNHRDIQEKVLDYFNSRHDLQTPLEISKDDHRELCMRQLVGLVREAEIRPFRYVVDDPSKYFAILEAVGCVDMSLGIKMGVQFR